MKTTLFLVATAFLALPLFAADAEVNCRLQYDLLNAENQSTASEKDKPVLASSKKEGNRMFRGFFFKSKVEEMNDGITPGYTLTIEISHGQATASRTIFLDSGSESKLETMSLTFAQERLSVVCQSEGIPQP